VDRPRRCARCAALLVVLANYIWCPHTIHFFSYFNEYLLFPVQAGSFPVQTGRGAEVDDAHIISDAVVVGFPNGHLELHQPHEPPPASDRKLLAKNRVGITALCLVADAARTHTNIGVGFADGNVCLLDLASCHAQPDAKPHLQEFLDLPRAQSKHFSVRELRFEAARFNFTASDRPSLGVLWCAFECSSGRTAAIKVAAAQLEKFREPVTGLKAAASLSLAASARDGVYRFGLKRLFDGDVVPESAHAGALRLVGFGALRAPTGGLGETERTQCVTDRMAASSGVRGEALALARGWGQGRRFAAWLAFSSNGATHAAVFDVLPENCLDGNAELHRARFSMSMHTLMQSAGDLALAVTLDPESLRDGTLLLSDASPIEHVDAVAATSAAGGAAAGAAGTDAASLDADGEFSPHELYVSDPLVSWSHAALHSIRQHSLTFRARVVVCAPSAAHNPQQQPQTLALGVSEIGFVGLQERMLAALAENAAGALAEASAFYRAACDAGLLLPPKSHRATAGAALQEAPHADYCRGRILSLCVRTGLSCGVGAAWIHARLPDVASWSASASSSDASSSSSSSSAAHGADGTAQASLLACDFLLQDPNWLVRWCGTQFRRMWHGRALADLLTAVDAALSASSASSLLGADASTTRLQPALALTWAQFARRASAAAAAAALSSSEGNGVDSVPEHVSAAIARALDGADSVGFGSSASASSSSAAASVAARSPFELAAALDLFCEYLDGLFLLLTSLRNLRAMRSAVMRACKAHGKHLGRRVHHLRALVFLLRNTAAEIAADHAGTASASASGRNSAAAASASSRLIDQARASSVAAVAAQWRADMQVVVSLSPATQLSSLPPASGVDIVSSSASAAALSAVDAPTSSLRQVLDLCELCRECDEGGASMPLLYLCMQVDEQMEERESARQSIQTAHARRSDAGSLARRFVDAFRVPAARYHAIAGMFCLDRAAEAQTVQGDAAVGDLCNRFVGVCSLFSFRCCSVLS
jgi:hypothetical protein